jgi:hypothetical protein
MRSTSLQFELAAGPVSSAMLQAAGADHEQFTISNGKDAAARRLLRNAVVQLYDSHNNPACVAGVLARWRLYCLDSAFFGDVGVEEGTGKMVRWSPVGTEPHACWAQLSVSKHLDGWIAPAPGACACLHPSVAPSTT